MNIRLLISLASIIFINMNIYTAAKILSEDQIIKIKNTKKLLDAIYDGDLKEVKKLVESGVDVNEPNTSGTKYEYPLINAIDMLSILSIEYNDFGQEINRSINPDRIEIVKNLIEAGANINSYNKPYLVSIVTNINSAHSSILPDVINLLINSGANVNIIDEEGNTPLMSLLNRISPSSGFGGYRGPTLQKTEVKIAEKIIKLLIDAGTDLNITNKEGKKAVDIIENWEKKLEQEKLAETFESFNPTISDSASIEDLDNIEYMVNKAYRKIKVAEETEKHLPHVLAKIVTDYDIWEKPKSKKDETKLTISETDTAWN